jgi:hypothetical protein
LRLTCDLLVWKKRVFIYIKTFRLNRAGSSWFLNRDLLVSTFAFSNSTGYRYHPGLLTTMVVLAVLTMLVWGGTAGLGAVGHARAMANAAKAAAARVAAVEAPPATLATYMATLET